MNRAERRAAHRARIERFKSRQRRAEARRLAGRMPPSVDAAARQQAKRVRRMAERAARNAATAGDAGPTVAA